MIRGSHSGEYEDGCLVGCSCARSSLIILMMEALRTSETLVNLNQCTRRYNPEDSRLLGQTLVINFLRKEVLEVFVGDGWCVIRHGVGDVSFTFRCVVQFSAQVATTHLGLLELCKDRISTLQTVKANSVTVKKDQGRSKRLLWGSPVVWEDGVFCPKFLLWSDLLRDPSHCSIIWRKWKVRRCCSYQ
jgi:hypothetical protein